MTIAHSNKVRLSFLSKVVEISKKLLIDPSWLMQVMYAESRLNHKAVNKYSGASGLIQFMPSTARGLKTTIESIRSMNEMEQLDYVYKYYLPYKGRINSYYDLYAATFFPAVIGKPDNWILQTKNLSPEIIAKQNPVVNIIKDNKITVAEFKEYVRKSVPLSVRQIVFNEVTKFIPGGGNLPAVIVILAFALLFMVLINN